MRPGSRDQQHKLRITGDELRELKRHVGMMAESFGLDRKIDAYGGVRPLTLYRWDLECLIAVIDLALSDKRKYRGNSSPDFQVLAKLGERLRQEYKSVYGE